MQHNPRDALALFVKCLRLLQNVIDNPIVNSQHVTEAKVPCQSKELADDGLLMCWQQLFTTVYDKAEGLIKDIPPDNGNGQTAEEILYECALAMVYQSCYVPKY